MLGVIVTVLGLVQPVDDLRGLGCEAATRGVPVVLYVSRSDCTFCRRMEREVLGPLIKSGTLDEAALLRELIWDQPGVVRDFRGHASTGERVARAYDATLTPTLLFLSATGEQISPPIRGYNGSDYYAYYIEAGVRAAGQAVSGTAIPAWCRGDP